MKKRRNHADSSVWMALPLYIFTIVFVVCPLIYMVALSFATPSRGFGVTWKFTLDNYKNILEPVYLNTFVESLKLALTSTVRRINALISILLHELRHTRSFQISLQAGKTADINQCLTFTLAKYCEGNTFFLYTFIKAFHTLP